MLLQSARVPTIDDDDDPLDRTAASSSSAPSRAPLAPDARPAPSFAGPSSPRPRSPFEDPEVESDEDEDSDSASFAAEDDALPLTHEVALKDHTKVVSALALDPSGARIASGSHDYECKLWDFGGMNASLKPFKSWEPAGSYYVCFLILDFLLR